MTAIGVFDSGVGGLTVLKAMRTVLPHESFVYLGDIARLPYGSKSPVTIKKYLDQNIHFLEKVGVKAIVVACNSASTVLSLESLPNIPIYGVIKPGARAALKVSRSKRIGILGTRATVHSEAYPSALMALDPSVFSIQQACPLLVPLVEEGWEQDPVTKLVLSRYLDSIIKAQVDTLILGCTHYPVLKSMIADLVGPDMALIDSAEVMANQIADDLAAGLISAATDKPNMRIWTTDVNDAFCRIAERIIAPLQVDHWDLAELNGGSGD